MTYFQKSATQFSFGANTKKSILKSKMENEDCILCLSKISNEEEVFIFILCDGVSSSSHPTGASSFSVDYLFKKINSLGFMKFMDYSDSIIKSCNLELNINYSNSYTTLCILLIHKNTAHYISIGDSSILKINQGVCPLNKKDRLSSDRNAISNCLGMIDSKKTYKFSAIELSKNDIIMIMSDGIHDFISNHDILKSINSENDICEELMSLAVSKGSKDDLSLGWYKHG